MDLGPRRRERSQDDSEDESGEDVEMALIKGADAHTRQVYAETAPTMRQWRCCFCFHANFCEQYCAAAEADKGAVLCGCWYFGDLLPADAGLSI